LYHIGRDVHVGVVGAAQELAGALGGDLLGGHRGGSPRSASATCERCVLTARSAASASPAATASTIARCSPNECSLRPGSRIVRYWKRTSWDLSVAISRAAVAWPEISRMRPCRTAFWSEAPSKSPASRRR